MRLLIKHRYTHFDPETGQKLETKYGMTAEAAAVSRMVKPKVIDDSRTEHYVSDSPTNTGFSTGRSAL